MIASHTPVAMLCAATEIGRNRLDGRPNPVSLAAGHVSLRYTNNCCSDTSLLSCL
jgi:hypothetical protein